MSDTGQSNESPPAAPTSDTAMFAPPSQSAASPTIHFRFMDLPIELRLLVYAELVVVGKVFFTPDEYSIRNGSRFKDYRLYRKPDLAILRVSKAVKEEAEAVYATQNLFVLPFQFGERAPFHERSVPGLKTLFSPKVMRQLRHASMEVSSRNAYGSFTMGRSEWEDARIIDGDMFDAMNTTERLDRAHEEAHHCYYYYRTHEMYKVSTRLEALRTIELDFTNAYCPFGCCRMICVDDEWRGLPDEKDMVRILGVRPDEESVLLTSLIDAEDLELCSSYKIEFGPGVDVWEKWKTDSRSR